MFGAKRVPKIKSITSTSAGDFLFLFGLGADNRSYIWNSVKAEWVLHRQVEQAPNLEPVTSQQIRPVNRHTGSHKKAKARK